MKDLTIKDVIDPIIRVSQFLCITPYSQKNGQMSLSKLRLLFTSFCVISNIACTVYYFRSSYSTIDPDFAKASTMKFLYAFRISGGLVIMLVILISGNVSGPRVQEQMEKISTFDASLTALGRRESVRRANYNSWKMCLFLLVLVNLGFNILGDFLPLFYEKQTTQILFLLAKLYPRIIIGNVNVSFFIFSLSMEKRFRMLNDLLREKIAESHKISKYPVSVAFSEEIRHLVGLHKTLIENCKTINSLFGLQALMCITVDFVLIIGDLHSSIYIIFFDLFRKHDDMVFNMLKNCAIYFFELCYLSKRSTELCNEANLTKNVLLGIRIDIEKEDERNTVIASALKLMQNKLEITACKLFTIDNALLFSIVGAVSSYLFIMLQLDMGSNKNNSTTQLIIIKDHDDENSTLSTIYPNTTLLY